MVKRLVALTAAVLLTASTALAAPEVGMRWDGDPENPQEGYVVYRRLKADTTYGEVARTGKLVATYTDTTVQKNNVYCWQVRAYLGPDTSPPSNEVCALVLNVKIKIQFE